ncbi:MAG TPA: hypothetical protein VLY23_17490 [Candidatus Acidoferrum sp.]|nr:hypothetical protein [Candidatus Acidoferrum sp.]
MMTSHERKSHPGPLDAAALPIPLFSLRIFSYVSSYGVTGYNAGAECRPAGEME